MIQASRLPIVLCCAEESEVALVAVVDVLHRDGLAPEVVPGVETDATLLTAATDRVRGPALFVLCQSDDLDRFQVRRLEGLFSARKGPAHRMVTIEVARRSTAAIVSEVRAAAREVSHGRGGRDDDDGSYMRDVVIPTSVAAVPGATIPVRGPARSPERGPERGAGASRGPEPGPGARGRAVGQAGQAASSAAIVQAPEGIEGISDEALGLETHGGGDETDTEVIDPFELHRRSRVAQPEVQLSTDPAALRALQSGADWETDPHPSDGVPLAVPEDYPMVGESGQDIEVRGAPRRGSWPDSGPVEVERVARPTKADPRAESDDRPLPSASTPIEIGRPTPPTAEPAPPERKGARVLLLLFAGAGMAAVITMAVLHATAPISGGPQDVHERGVPTEAAAPDAEPTPPSQPPSKAEPAAKPTPEPTPAASTGPARDDAAAASGADADVGTSGEVGASTGADAGGADAASDGAEDRGEATDDGNAVAPEGGTKLVPPPPATGPSAPAGEATLEVAIAEGRVRELGTLLMITTGPSTVTWDEATSRCGRRKVGGVGNWKLPTKGQLGELRRAKLLAPGTYWSRSTVGDDEAFVVDAGSGEAAQWLKMEPNGRVVCVRPRPS